jgi:branched-chain amino acid transport system permease protein
MNKRSSLQSVAYLFIVVALFLLPTFGLGPYALHLCIVMAMNVILASSLRLIFLTGQMSLAHGAMMTVGAYTSALLVMKLGFSSWLALLLCGFPAAILALIIGYPLTKLKGMYFAMVTIFIAQILQLVGAQWRGLTGGAVGIFNIPGPDPVVIPGVLKADFSAKADFYYLVLILTIVSLLIFWAIERSRVGLTFRGLSQSDSMTESVGIDTATYKVLAFVIGCFFPGLTGGFYSQYVSAIAPDTFAFLFTIYILIYMIVGGSGKFLGPIVGAAILTILPEIARPLKEYVPFLFAAILMLVIFFFPGGIMGLPERLRQITGRARTKEEVQHAGN